MPRADFRYRNDSLDPLALVKLLAVMCYPADARGREAMMRRQPSRITLPRHDSGQPDLADGFAADVWAEFAAHRARGCLAGALCLSLAQTSALGRAGEAAAVLILAGDLAARWEAAAGPENVIRPLGGLPPPREEEIVAAFERYRSVSHLWATAVYGRIQDRRDLVPRSLLALPRFLAFGAEIARLAVTLQWTTPHPPLALQATNLWEFQLPSALTRKAEAEIRQAAAQPGLPPEAPAAAAAPTAAAEAGDAQG